MQECATVGEVLHRSEEGEPPSPMLRDQPGEEEPAEQLAEHAHREKECRPRRYPAASVRRDAAARHDHMDMRIWCVIADPQVWSTAVMPMRAPRCFGSAAIVSTVSDAALNSRS